MTKKNINIASILLLIALTIIIGISLAIAKAKGLLAQLDPGPNVAVVLRSDLLRADAGLVEKVALQGSLLKVERTLLPGLEVNEGGRLLERSLVS
jgi:hypothetical protein